MTSITEILIIIIIICEIAITEEKYFKIRIYDRAEAKYRGKNVIFCLFTAVFDKKSSSGRLFFIYVLIYIYIKKKLFTSINL